MKVYPYIVIDKSSMQRLEHVATATRVADILFDACAKIPDRYIVIKDEREVVDLSSLRNVTGLPMAFHRKLIDLL